MADRISKTVYPSLRFPRQPLPPHPPALDLPLEMIPDFRPEQVRPVPSPYPFARASFAISPTADFQKLIRTLCSVLLALFASQAFLKSIRPFLTSRGPDEPSAKDDDETSALKAFDWGHETLDIDWRGIFRLAVKAQVRALFLLVWLWPPFVRSGTLTLSPPLLLP